jgi:hypothetical protein
MSDGEVLEGDLTLLGGGAQAEAMVFGSAGTGTSGWSATMVLHGHRGQAMQCRLTLSRSADHGFGHCRTTPEAANRGAANRGAMYQIEF